MANPNHDAKGEFSSAPGGKAPSVDFAEVQGQIDAKMADEFRTMGREWVDAVAANDTKFADARAKVDSIDTRLTALNKQAESNLRAIENFQQLKVEDRTPKEQDKFVKASAKVDDQVRKISALEMDRYAANADAAKRIGEWVKAGSPASGTIAVTNHMTDPAERAAVDQHVRDFQTMIGGGLPRNSQIDFKPLAEGVAGPGWERSCYSSADNTIYLAPGDAGKGEVVFHEMGHWMEANIGGGPAAARGFLASRTAGETARPLNGMNDFYGHPMSGYRDNEMAKPDKFRDPYVGKIYAGGRATEVTSMGMQYLKESATQFYKMDRGHFEFTVGMIRAARTQG